MGWVPTFLIVFALVFVLVWGLRALLNVVGASPSVQGRLFEVFRVLAAVGYGLELLGGLTLVVRPQLLRGPRAGLRWWLRISGVAIGLVGGLGTVLIWLPLSFIAIANPLPLVGLVEFLAALVVVLLPITAYLLLLGLVLRGAGVPSVGRANDSTALKRHRVPPRFVVHLTLRLRRFLVDSADRLLPPHIALLEHAYHFAVVHLLAAFAELGIADHLGDGPKTAKELAGLIQGDADALHRALRAAAEVGIVRLDAAGTFHATRLTIPLRSQDPSAAADWCRFLGSPALQVAWSDLSQTLRTGENAFRRVNGMDPFRWFDTHPEEGRRFTAGLGGLTRAEAAMIVAAYRFPEQGVLCDVAGGAGVLLGEILQAHPGLRGILVEAPLVLTEAGAYLESIGLADRVQLVHGDFFAPIQVTADLYLLKWILHDWDNQTCTVILKNIAAAMSKGARLVVIEGDQARNRAHARFSMLDAQMLVASEGGRERSGAEIAQLLADAGLHPRRLRHTATDLVLVEATVQT
jgi:hypothetical protein